MIKTAIVVPFTSNLHFAVKKRLLVGVRLPGVGLSLNYDLELKVEVAHRRDYCLEQLFLVPGISIR